MTEGNPVFPTEEYQEIDGFWSINPFDGVSRRKVKKTKKRNSKNRTLIKL